MDNKQIKATLHGMMDKTFQYAGQVHYVKSCIVDEEGEKCIIKTNLASYDRKFENIKEFLEYWKPINSIPAPILETNRNQQLSILIEQEKALSNRLIDILNDNIEKVQESKEYIPQAQAVNNNINTIVNIAKMRLDLVKHMKGFK